MDLATLRVRAGAMLIDNSFRALSRLSQLNPKADPAKHDVSVTRELFYDTPSTPWRRLDVWRPNSARIGGTSPALLYIHGGGFRILSKDTHWVMALAFARAGYTVFNIDYRLAPKNPFPAAVEDVVAAYEWVAKHAPEHGADLSKFVIAGESAGANLTLGLALASSLQHDTPLARRVFATGLHPKAIAPMCGYLQASDGERFARRKPSLPTFIADRIHEIEKAYLTASPYAAQDPMMDLADPLCWLERKPEFERKFPPTFTAVGTGDPILDDTRRLGKTLSEQSIPHELHYFKGEVHAYHAFVWRQASRQTWQKKLAFLERVLTEPDAVSDTKTSTDTSTSSVQ